MNKSILKVIALLVLLQAFPAGADAQRGAARTPRQTATPISGRITDVSGNPVSGARVTAMEGLYFATTDEGGAFTVKSGAADYILVEAPGFEPREVYLPDMLGNLVIALEQPVFMDGTADRVNMPFGELTKRRITGAVNSIDMDIYKNKFMSHGFTDILRAEGFGVFGATDVRGTGYTIMIDGLVRDGNSAVENFSGMIKAEEIEEITVLKDAASRMLYGTYADKGIIMIKTRRGEAHQRKMNFSYEGSVGIPKAMPHYLRTGDYMILLNEARTNDGLDRLYNHADIEAARSGVDPLKYPDQDYFTSEFLRGFKPQQRVMAEFIGGSRIARYYLNAGYYGTHSIIGMGESNKQRTDRFNIRGNIDVNINKYISVSLDAAAIFNAWHGPNWKNGNFWRLSSENPVNAYPFLIPIDRINEDYMGLVEEAITQRSVIDGKYLVGGNSRNENYFTRNPYGDLFLGGYANTMDRMAHINMGIDVDLSWLTQGLQFNTYFGTDNYNQYTTTQSNSYAVYNPIFFEDGTIGITQIGANDFVGTQSMSGVAFYRRMGWNNRLNYDRTFGGRHDVSAVAMSSMHYYKQSNFTHAEKSMNFGGRVNYMFDRKYVAEYSGAYIGSSYLARDNRWGYAQSVGLGWIISEESFLEGAGWLDYLKLKGTFANTKTDDGFSNYLYTDIYSPGDNYNYGDATGQNAMMSFSRGNPGLGWAQRREFNAGIEFSTLGHRISGEVNYFNSLRYDELTVRTDMLPGFLGGSIFLPSENYNSRRQDGIEAQLVYTDRFGDFGLRVAADMIWFNPKWEKYAEVKYPAHLSYLNRTGSATDAIRGLVADGFYTQADIDLMNGGGDIARPSYGTVQAGDIRYRDTNGDMVIDDEDFTVIGNTHARFAYGLNITLSWRNWEFFAYMSAQTGYSKNYIGNSYYAVYGTNAKYPVHLLGRWAYDPQTGVDTRETATYPRLTTSSSGTTHNYGKNSTFWLRNQNHFSIPSLQLSYHLGDKLMKPLRLKDVTVYVRAADVLWLGPDRERAVLNTGSEFQYAWLHFGVKLNF